MAMLLALLGLGGAGCLIRGSLKSPSESGAQWVELRSKHFRLMTDRYCGGIVSHSVSQPNVELLSELRHSQSLLKQISPWPTLLAIVHWAQIRPFAAIAAWQGMRQSSPTALAEQAKGVWSSV